MKLKDRVLLKQVETLLKRSSDRRRISFLTSLIALLVKEADAYEILENIDDTHLLDHFDENSDLARAFLNLVDSETFMDILSQRGWAMLPLHITNRFEAGDAAEELKRQLLPPAIRQLVDAL